MKCKVGIDLVGRSLTLECAPETIEECATVVDALKGGLRSLFPDIVFSGDEDFEDDPAPKLKHGRRGGSGFIKVVKPGSLFERVRDAANRLGTRDAQEIADDLDLLTSVAGMAVAKLTRAGFLTEQA